MASQKRYIGINMGIVELIQKASLAQVDLSLAEYKKLIAAEKNPIKRNKLLAGENEMLDIRAKFVAVKEE